MVNLAAVNSKRKNSEDSVAVPSISEAHRKELLRFLLEKTAAVRMGVKPGELLRVQDCYATLNEEGLRFCIRRTDIYDLLKLDFIELIHEEQSSLVLFFDPALLARTLRNPDNRAILGEYGYPCDATADRCVARLRERFAENGICHEVGVFVGYPAKDVRAYIEHLPTSSPHRTPWRVFGDAVESIRLADLYRRAENFARTVLDAAPSVGCFVRMCNRSCAVRLLAPASTAS